MREAIAQGLFSKPIRTINIRNNNASVALVDGQPVYLDNNNVTSVNLGVDVKRYSEALGSSPLALFLGVVKTGKSAGIVLGDFGEAVCYGITDVVVTRRTRAASTDSWASVASMGAGDQLIPESIGNNFSWLGVVQQVAVVASGSTGQTITLPQPIYVVLMESKASLASAVSTLVNGSGLLYDAYRMKALVRAM